MRQSALRRCAAATLVTLLFLLVSSADTAVGNPYGANGWYYPPDSHMLYFYGSGFGATWRDAADYTYSNNINPTHMQASTVPDWSLAWVAAYVGDFGDTTWQGQAACSLPGGDVCYFFDVRMNTHNHTFTGSEKYHMVCHEFGHTVGLEHYTSSSPSCMEAQASKDFSSHDTGHINAYF